MTTMNITSAVRLEDAPKSTTVACDHDATGQCAFSQVETVLQEIPGPIATDRLLIVHVERCDGGALLLRQQNRAPGIGWFTQSSVEINAGQLGPLRLALQAAPPLTSIGGQHFSDGRPRLKVVS